MGEFESLAFYSGNAEQDAFCRADTSERKRTQQYRNRGTRCVRCYVMIARVMTVATTVIIETVSLLAQAFALSAFRSTYAT